MKIIGFIWLEEIVQKLDWKHSVIPDEVREVFENKPRIQFVEKGHRKDENVYAALGQTNSGRYLICYFVEEERWTRVYIIRSGYVQIRKKIIWQEIRAQFPKKDHISRLANIGTRTIFPK